MVESVALQVCLGIALSNSSHKNIAKILYFLWISVWIWELPRMIRINSQLDRSVVEQQGCIVSYEEITTECNIFQLISLSIEERSVQ